MEKREKLGKDLVNALTSLYLDYPWLGKKANEVVELLDFCSNRDEQELLIQLLSLFEFITPERYEECLASICAQIASIWNLEERNSVLASFTADEEADSGQVILYDVRTALAQKHGWHRTKTVNTFGKVQKFVDTRPNVILVDEFIGTGRTLIGRITELQKQFSQKGITNFQLHACVVAGMSFGLTNVKETTGLEVFSVKTCFKGISELLPEEKREQGGELMASMEDRLAQRYCDIDLPHFGDARGEALYGRMAGNCPNTVFPLFWWPKTIDNSNRKTLLVRNIGAK